LFDTDAENQFHR